MRTELRTHRSFGGVVSKGWNAIAALFRKRGTCNHKGKMKKIFVISDTHWNHANIIKYCDRPFASVEEMNAALIKQWNEIVGKEDIVYHLGDFSFGSEESILNIAKQLNGNLKIVPGNHDNKIKRMWSKMDHDYLPFEVLPLIYSKKIGNTNFVMCHFPLDDWHGLGDVHLHGHCVDMKTEILTKNGWKNRNQLDKNDLVLSYDLDSQIFSEEKIDEIVDIHNYNGDVFELNAKSIDMCVTSNHTIINFSQDHSKALKRTANILFKQKRATFLLSGLSHKIGIALSDPLLKLFILIAADGNIKIETNLVRIVVQKNRKKEYIESVLKLCNIEFKKYSHNKQTSFNFYLPKELKQYNIKGLDKELLNCNQNQFESILEAYKFSDGSENGKGVIIYSAKENEIDLLQALAISCGYSATKGSRYHGLSKNLQFQLSIYKRQFIRQNVSNFNKRLANNEHFWCIKTKNQNFFMRRNGKVHLTGNSHGKSEYKLNRYDVGYDVQHTLMEISHYENNRSTDELSGQLPFADSNSSNEGRS